MNTILRFHLTPVRFVHIQNLTTHAGLNVGERHPNWLLVGEQASKATVEVSMESVQKTEN